MKVKFEFTLTEKSSAATMVQDILHEFALSCEVEDGKLKVPSFESRMRVARDCIQEALKALKVESNI
jgi:hypothetical protein